MPMPKQKPGRSKQNYATPADFIEAVKNKYKIKEFSHDFAADQFNSKALTFFSELNNALDYTPIEWARLTLNEWGWLNPPYTKIGLWAAHSNKVAQLGGKLLMLVPASVGSNWFHQFVHSQFNVVFLNGRIHFDPDNPTWGYPKDCMLVEFVKPIYPPTYSVWKWK